MTSALHAYEVPGVQLIVQDQNKACWFASAMMLLNWKERYRPGSSTKECSPLDQQTIDLYKANNGIQNSQIIPLATRLGLVAVPPLSPTVSALRHWLMAYGALWTNGKQHIVVIGGIRTRAGVVELKVFDPWPGAGVGWRSLAGWYTGLGHGAGVDSRDTGFDVQAVFLRAP